MEKTKKLMLRIAKLHLPNKNISINFLYDKKQLGYTNGQTISLMCVNDIKNKFNFTLDEAQFFQYGVFCHELCHILFTDFDYANIVINEIEGDFNKRSFADFWNILEDPAIEYFSCTRIGGWLYEALVYTIKTLYDFCPELEFGVNSVYSQYRRAMIQYGDKYSLKGSFSIDRAKELFWDYKGNVDQIITCPIPSKRIDLSFALFDEIKSEILSSDIECDSYEQTVKSFGKGSIAPKGGITPIDGEVLIPSNCDSQDLDTDNIIKGSDSGGLIDEFDDFLKTLLNSDKGDNSSSFKKSKQEPKQLDFTKSISDMYKEISKESSDVEAPKPENVFSNTTKYKEYKNDICICPPTKSEDRYNKIIFKNKQTINNLTSQFSRLFVNENGNKRPYTSGTFNSSRYVTIGNQSLNWFDKRTKASNRKDASILFLVDESGSTGGIMKDIITQLICLVESLTNNNIPTAVVGFTMPFEQSEYVTHTWYCDFENTKKTKENVIEICSKEDNFDGYSIDYATCVLNKRKTKNKLLVVLSDGAPYCDVYYDKLNGISDTAESIKSAKSSLDVIGIQVGSSDTKILQKLWGDDYILSRSPEDLCKLLVPKLKKIIRNW